MKNVFIAFVFSVLSSGMCTASTEGIHGPLYLTPAWSLVKGDLVFHGHSRFYFKNEVNDHQGSNRTAVTLWNAQGAFAVFYGLNNNFEIGLSQVIYQDAHSGRSGKGYNLPDDIYLKLKMTSLGPDDLPVQFGFQMISRIPFAKYHNVPLEPYSAGKTEFSFTTLASFSLNSLLPQKSMNMHANLGYVDHNDSGEKLIDGDKKTYYESTGSKELVYGVGLIYPISKFDFSLEFYGNRYLTRPPEAAYSRYSYMYVTPGICYAAYDWLSVIFGFDFRLTAARPNQSARTISINTPVFPTWRLNFGVKFNMTSRLQHRSVDKEGAAKMETGGDHKKDIYKQIAEEKKQVEDAEKELTKIYEERKKMDEILKRLRDVLEDEKDNVNK